MDEDLKTKIAVSDEMMLRILCSTYSLGAERSLDLNKPGDAAALMTGALRFAAALSRAHEMTSKQFTDRAADAFATPPQLAVVDDPGVKRWMETFRQLWGKQVPFAFIPRVQGDSFH